LKGGGTVRKNNWDIGLRIKLFISMFLMLLAFYIILLIVVSRRYFDFWQDIDWQFLIILSAIYGFLGANRYKKIDTEIPIADKAGFKALLKDCIEYTRLKIISEGNDTFLLKPKLVWTDLWLWNERVAVTVEENQAIIKGPGIYVEKLKTMLDAFS
jgi:Ca2+/Na+ antiporter